eukprot:12035514-Alexandrium_andersonii.AAC.1
MCIRDRFTELTHPEPRGSMFMSVIGPAQIKLRTLEVFCMSRKADCGLRRIAPSRGNGRIGDGSLGTLQ